MFIYNIKFNAKGLVKILFVIIAIVISMFFIISTFKIYQNSFKVNDSTDENSTMYLTAENYTNILKAVHEDIDSYVNKKICFTGYVYRLSDFKDTEFVLARDMFTSSGAKTFVVGFLCDCKNAKSFESNSWVEITGKITKGYYHGDMPVIEILNIEQINKPEDDIYSYPPDDTYIPTSYMF